ncbi:MAG: hypothetical protein KTR31_16755 [Myxococcales bacterium]|nr:hypothetical protein [Myxococcales bacterium]
MRWGVAGLLWAGCAPEVPVQPTCSRADGEICTVAGTGQRGFNGDGAALETHLFLPTGGDFDPDALLLVVDHNNMVIRRLEPNGDLPAVVGVGRHAYATDGSEAHSSPMENPIDVAAAEDGTLFIMELHGARVLQVDPTGWLTVYAGSVTQPGTEAYEGDGGPAREALMSQATGLALADDGTLFISDTGNHAVRMVTPDGIIDTLAGNGLPGFVDGVGADAQLAEPQRLTWHEGAVWVADTGNHAVRHIDVQTGEVTTVVGTGIAGFSGDGGPASSARLDAPQGVTVSPEGIVYVADTGNHVVRRIDLDGTVTTVVGQPEHFGFEGDFGPGADAVLSRPQQVLVHDDDLFVFDTFNDVVRCVYGGAR